MLATGVKRVNVVPDNDAPGFRDAEREAAAYSAAGLDVYVIVLPGLERKGDDVTDWFNQGGTAERLCLLADAAAPWQPSEAAGAWPPDRGGINGGSAGRRRRRRAQA